MSDRDLPVNFSSFIVSLASSAMMHLGEAANPDSGDKQVNLPLARNTIDVLAVLQQKTKGNLDDDEKQLLGTLVEDLEARYDKVAG